MRAACVYALPHRLFAPPRHTVPPHHRGGPLPAGAFPRAHDRHLSRCRATSFACTSQMVTLCTCPQALCLSLYRTFTPFLAIFGSFLGHIVEPEGTKGLLVMGQLRRTWSVGTVCLCLALLTRYRGRFGTKKAVLGHKMRSFGRAPPVLAPPPWGAIGEFLAQNLDLARTPPRLWAG